MCRAAYARVHVRVCTPTRFQIEDDENEMMKCVQSSVRKGACARAHMQGCMCTCVHQRAPNREDGVNEMMKCVQQRMQGCMCAFVHQRVSK